MYKLKILGKKGNFKPLSVVAFNTHKQLDLQNELSYLKCIYSCPVLQEKEVYSQS